jgi:gluconolactonase
MKSTPIPATGPHLRSGFSAAILALLAAGAGAREPSIERLDPALDALLDADAEIEMLGDGFTWVEGPAWNAAARELLFSEIPKNVIHAWNPEGGMRVFMQPSGYTGVADYGGEPGSNGLAFDANGDLLLCEHGDRRIARLTPGGGKITVADRHEGRRFNSPNDLAVHSNGAIFFTDPIYGLPHGENDPMREMDFCGVFRVDPDGAVMLLTDEIERPNGIALSPDERTLYIANSHGPRPYIFALELGENGVPGELRTFFDTSTLEGRGAPDGMKVDAAGNLWATGPGGLLILSPDARLLGRVLIHRPTANIAFGGDDGKSVFLTSSDRILRFTRK